MFTNAVTHPICVVVYKLSMTVSQHNTVESIIEATKIIVYES